MKLAAIRTELAEIRQSLDQSQERIEALRRVLERARACAVAILAEIEDASRNGR